MREREGGGERKREQVKTDVSLDMYASSGFHKCCFINIKQLSS